MWSVCADPNSMDNENEEYFGSWNCLLWARFVARLLLQYLIMKNNSLGARWIFTKQSQLFESERSSGPRSDGERWRDRQKDWKKEWQISRAQTNRRCDRVMERRCYACCWGGIVLLLLKCHFYATMFKYYHAKYTHAYAQMSQLYIPPFRPHQHCTNTLRTTLQ